MKSTDCKEELISETLLFQENVPLKEFCTFAIGGPSRYFLEIRTIEMMQKAILHCHQHNIPYLILGKGSNCLFDDKGFNGAVLLNKINFFEQTSPGVFHAGAGYSFALLGVQTARQGWSGLEFASGIPGSVGGAVYMNAGANGQETCQTLASVDYIDSQGRLKVFTRDELTYSYRHSPFQHMKGAIIGASFVLKELEDARKKQIEIVNHRKKTQPLQAKSAGCIFLNPQGCHAGAMIEKCGLKGFSIGGAQISEIHANFLINAERASCQDILKLIDHVKNSVKSHSGVELMSEVHYIPYEPR